MGVEPHLELQQEIFVNWQEPVEERQGGLGLVGVI